MTNELSVEEAIELLKEKRMEINYQVNGTTQFSRALDMAIKASEQLQEKPEYIDIWNVGAILRNIPEQPDICKIYGGVCGHPIEACSECPKHEGWRPSKEQKSYKSDARRWERRYLDLKQRIFKLEEQTRWIPVSEGLPKESGNYFVTISFDVMGGQEPAREVYKDYFSVLSQKWLYHGEDVIAWMPLPPSYQGE